MGKCQAPSSQTIAPTCQKFQTKSQIIQSFATGLRTNKNHPPCVEDGAVGDAGNQPGEADQISNVEASRLLVRRGAKLPRDLFTLNPDAPDLRKRMFQREMARKVLAHHCEDLLPQVVQEAEHDPVAQRVERDLRLTVSMTQGYDSTKLSVEKKKTVTRVTTFLRRKTISDMMVEMVSRGRRAMAFAHWKNIVDSSPEISQVEVPPTKAATYTMAGLCAVWEKVISRHENLVATSLAVAAAGASLPLSVVVVS